MTWRSVNTTRVIKTIATKMTQFVSWMDMLKLKMLVSRALEWHIEGNGLYRVNSNTINNGVNPNAFEEPKPNEVCNGIVKSKSLKCVIKLMNLYRSTCCSLAKRMTKYRDNQKDQTRMSKGTYEDSLFISHDSPPMIQIQKKCHKHLLIPSPF